MRIGATDANGGDVLVMKLLNKVAGTQFTSVPGYPGGNDLNLAVERGEIDGRCQSWISIKASRAAWVADKKLTVLIQASTGKSADLPGVPSILDIAGSEEDRQAIKLAFAEQEMGNPFVAAPGTPPEIQQMLRNALARTLSDPAFLAEAQQLKFDLDPVSGEEVQQIIEAAYGAPQAIIDRTHHLVSD
jgi:tripartite-type tricarboxylate transporter receptor subunit TctC